MSGIDSDSAQSQSTRSYFFGSLTEYQLLGASSVKTKDRIKLCSDDKSRDRRLDSSACFKQVISRRHLTENYHLRGR
jgi:hypothetical protein